MRQGCTVQNETEPPPEPAAEAPQPSGPLLWRVWNGYLPLADAFWMWGVVGGLIVNGTTSALFLILLAADHAVWAIIVGNVPSIPYNIFVGVGIWRAAGRYDGDRRLATLTRVVSPVMLVLLSVT